MIACPKCGLRMLGKGLGSHAKKCGVPLELIFWQRVDRRGPDECWPWLGRRDTSGYGRYDRKGTNVYAHRIAFRLTYGPVPDGKDVLHSCDHRWCCNPLHYFLGTQSDNNADMRAKGRGYSKLTPEQVLDIRAAFQGVSGRAAIGALQRSLAAKYNTTDKWIWAIRAGRKWRSLLTERRGDVEKR